MAASSVFLSLAWLTERDSFKAFLEAGYGSRSEMESFVKPEFADTIFKGLNQFFYWSRKLCDIENEAAITLAVMGHTGLIKPNIMELHKQITLLLGPGKLKNINYPENTNFVTLLLDSVEAAQAVRQGVLMIDEALVCYVNRRPHNNYKVRILWAPLLFPLEGIHDSLKTWCASSSFEFEMNRFDNGDVVPTNIISGTITLKDNVSLQQLPHVVKLEKTNKYIMLVIRERPPLCLKCRREGHIRKFCSWAKCLKCSSYHNIDDACISKSYASVLGIPNSGVNGVSHNSMVNFIFSGDMTLTHDKTKVLNNGGPLTISNSEVGSGKMIDNSLGTLVHTMDMKVPVDSAKLDHENFTPVIRRGTRRLPIKTGSFSDQTQVENDTLITASGSFQGLDDEMDHGGDGNDDLYVSEPESEHCLGASAVEAYNEKFQGSDYAKKGKKQKRNNTLPDFNQKRKKQHSDKNGKLVIASSLAAEEQSIQNTVVDEDNPLTEVEEFEEFFIHESQVKSQSFGPSKVDGVLTRAAAKALSDGSLDKVTTTSDEKVSSQINEDEADTLVQAVIIKEVVQKESLPQVQNTNEILLGSDSSDDESGLVLQFPIILICSNCETKMVIRQKPVTAVLCSGCHLQLILNSAGTRFDLEC